MKSRTITVAIFCAILISGLAIGLFTVWSVFTAQAAPAAEFIVTSEAADPDIHPGDGNCATAQGGCTLTAAIQEANWSSGPDTITFAGSVNLINIWSNQLLPAITDDGTTIDGGDHVRLYCVYAGTTALSVNSDGNRIRGVEIDRCEIGILIQTGSNNIIGVEGNTPYNEGGNNIHDSQTGIMLSASSNNSISGNDFNKNHVADITIDSFSSHNIIGVVDTAMYRDYLSNFLNGSYGIGIQVQGNENLVAGNHIYGGDIGISVSGESNRIGTDGDGVNDADEINWIHHGLLTGVEFTGDADNNVLAGNYIGTGENGLGDDGVYTGVSMGGSANVAGPNHDGISDEVERNIISGNYTGLALSCWGCTIRGNYFGTDVTGSGEVGNHTYAIHIDGITNMIGGEEPWQANLIAFGGGDGIFVDSGAHNNQILGNVIFANDNLGIDLAPVAQVNPNDDGDWDGGANNGQNYPILSMVTTDGSSYTHILGSLNSQPEESFRLEFYANEACHASGYGEGQTYLDSIQVTTDIDGNAAIDLTLPISLSVDTAVTALATDLSTGDTSEFSACTLVTAEPLAGALVVNSTADQVDLDSLDAVCDTGDLVGDAPECTLRAAIQQANASPGWDYISLPAGVYTLVIPGTGESDAATGDLDINDDLTLNGAGAEATIVDGGGIDRVFDIGPNDTSILVMLHYITIQHGGGAGVLTGQGIANRATLGLYRSVVRYNGGSYGSIYNFPTGALTMMSSTVYGNTTTGNGAGIYAQNYVQITNSTISGNASDDNGGGIYVLSGSVYIYNSTITDNTADADDDNAGQGGGIYNGGAIVDISNSLIVNNLDLGDAGNRNGTEAFDCYGDFDSSGYNLVTDLANDNDGINDPLCTGFDAEGDGTSGYWLFSTYMVFNVQLEPLALNGGTTPSHRPLLDKDLFVIDTGSPLAPGEDGACEADDQRGIPRPIDGDGDGTARCDRGAIETTLPLISITDMYINEGESDVLVVELYPASPISVTVTFTISPGTASAGSDYTPITATLVFEPGVVTQTLEIETLEDSLDEETETFFMGLSNQTNAALGQSQAAGSITDDDAPPSTSIADVTVTEGDTGFTQAFFIVTLSSASGKQIQVQATSIDDTANGQDYTPVAQLLTFAPGEITKTVTVLILGDTLVEEEEQFMMALGNSVNVIPGDPIAVCTIIDTDQVGGNYKVYLPLLMK